MLVDPNKWSEDGTVAMRSFAVSDDGRYLAYARADAGSDWQQIYVLDVEKNELLDDQLKWVRFGGIDWTKDGRGFYYNRYPEPPPGEQYQSAALNQMVYFHKLGTKQEDDTLIYRRPDHPDWGFSVRADRRRQISGALDRPQHRSAESGLRARSIGRGRRALDGADRRFRERVLVYRQ